MAISTTIPESWRLPLFWANVDGTQAGNLTEAEPALLVGQMFTVAKGASGAGTATLNVPIPVGSDALAQNLFGAGSMLERMVQEFFQCNTTQELWALPVAEPSAGTAATGNISFAGTSLTGSGVFTLYIAGQKVQITVQSTDTAPTIAANLVAAVNALPEVPVIATLEATNSPEVIFTCKWKGLTGNDITLWVNYLGLYGGEVTPAGLVYTLSNPLAGVAGVGNLAGGTGEPTFTTAIANIQTFIFDYVAMPFTDTASMASWNTEYGFSSGGRWNYTRQQYGMILNAYRDDYADMLEWGLTQNSPVMSTMAVDQASPSPVWEWSAAYCADAALGFTDDPARPLQTLELTGILPAPMVDLFSQGELNALQNSGLAIQSTAPGGTPQILREQTQYQFNSYGQADTAFGLLTILATLQELLNRMRAAITTKYPRVKLVPDGTALGPGQAAVTPSILAAELVSEFGQAEYDGLVSDLDDFKKNLIVEIDDQNPNRVNVLWPPQLAGQLRQFAVDAQFRLEYPIDVSTQTQV
jgi:phage tail sheath gpL-like